MKGLNSILLSVLVVVVAFFVYSDHQDRLKLEEQARQDQETLHAYQQARKVHTAETYANFLVIYPDTKYTEEALHYRDERLLEKAKLTKDIEAIEGFIQAYPNSSHQSAARWWRDQLIIDQIKDSPSIEAYEDFLQKYPRSSWAKHAIHKRDGLIYKQLKKINTEEAYAEFIAEYPQSPYKEKVKLKLKALKENNARRESFADLKNKILSGIGRGKDVSPLVTSNVEERAAKLKSYNDGTFDFSSLPKNIATVFLSAYRGQQSTISIDLPKRPILLILNSHLPVEWEIDFSEVTQVAGVLVSSYEPGSKLYTEKNVDAYLIPKIIPKKTFRFSRSYDDYYFRKTLHWLNEKAPHINQFDYFHSENRFKSQYLINSLPALKQWSLNWPTVEKPTHNFEFFLNTEALHVGQLLPASNTQEQNSEVPGERQLLPKYLTEPREIPRETIAIGNMKKTYSMQGPKFDNASIHTITQPYLNAIVEENSSYYTFDHNGIKRFDLTTNNLLKHYPLPSNFGRFSHPTGIAYDSKNKYITVVTSGGDGAFYRFDTLKKQWKDYRSFNRVFRPNSLSYSAKGNFYAVSTSNKIVILSDDGIPIESHSLKDKLPGYKQTFNGQPPPLSIIANGNVLALVNIPGGRAANPEYRGMVTQIWEYERDTQQSRLTYYVDIAAPSTP